MNDRSKNEQKLRDELFIAVNHLVEQAGLSEEVSHRELTLAGIVRHEWSRRKGTSRRYLRIEPVMVGPWSYTILGGSWRDYIQKEQTPDEPEFDGRRGGNLDYTLAIVKYWLIELKPSWDLIGSFDTWSLETNWD